MTESVIREERVTAESPPIAVERFAEVTNAILGAITSVIDGKPEAARSALICLLAEGHLLIEDVPGVGKTMLARALAASIDAAVRRIQFTPDLLPGDVTGVSAFNPIEREFEFKPGAVFANIVIADEISPDTMRLWDEKGEPLDKDRFRKDLGGVEEAYREVLRRVLG